MYFRKFIIAISFVTLTCSSFAQLYKLDSLKSVIDTAKGQEKVKTLNRLAWRYAFNQFDSALKYVEWSLKLSREYNYDSLGLEGLNIKGILYDIQGETDSAEFYFLKTYHLSIEKEIFTYERFSINNLGMMYWRRGDFNQALEFFFKALKYSDKFNKQAFKSVVLSNIGLIYQEMKQFGKAFEYHKKAINLRKELDLVDELPTSYNNLGICYKNLQNIDSAIICYNLAADYAKISSNKSQESTAYSNLGVLYFEKGDYLVAKNYLLEALEIDKSEQKAVMVNHLNLSGVYFALKEYQQGIKQGLIAKELLERDKNFGLGLNTYKFLALNYAATGNNELSLKYHARWEELSDSTFSEANARAISKLEVEYETEKKEKELLKERADNERLAKEKALAEIRVYNRNKWIVGISGLSLIVILSALALGQRKRRKMQAEKDAAIIEEREKGIKAVFDAQEEERQRIAKDLHDGVGQQISAVKIHLQGFKKETAAKFPDGNSEIDNIVEMISETGNDIRNISHQMMPRALTELGLVAALEDMLEKSFKYHNIEYSFENHGLENRLPDHVEIGLYRIAQELINNILKHAGASKVDVQLMKTKSHCILIVQDDGKGLGDKDKSDGIGMMNISNRLRTLKGELNMESDTGAGTTATIRVALT